jgi:hypothetical protein
VTIKLEDGSLLKGKINLLSEPTRDINDFYDKFLDDKGNYYRRISDIFAKGKNPFVVVFDALMENEAEKLLIINKKDPLGGPGRLSYEPGPGRPMPLQAFTHQPPSPS